MPFVRFIILLCMSHQELTVCLLEIYTSRKNNLNVLFKAYFHTASVGNGFITAMKKYTVYLCDLP